MGDKQTFKIGSLTANSKGVFYGGQTNFQNRLIGLYWLQKSFQNKIIEHYAQRNLKNCLIGFYEGLTNF
jgi:hypothetical protein